MSTPLTPEQRAACAEVERLLRELDVYDVGLFECDDPAVSLYRRKQRILDGTDLASAIERARAARGKP